MRFLSVAMVFCALSGSGALADDLLVRDICLVSADGGACGGLGPFEGNGAHLVKLGNSVVFVADDGAHGLEPWRSDGTLAGTTIVADIAPGPASSVARELFSFKVIDGRVFYASERSDGGVELYEVLPGGYVHHVAPPAGTSKFDFAPVAGGAYVVQPLNSTAQQVWRLALNADGGVSYAQTNFAPSFQRVVALRSEGDRAYAMADSSNASSGRAVVELSGLAANSVGLSSQRFTTSISVSGGRVFYDEVSSTSLSYGTLYQWTSQAGVRALVDHQATFLRNGPYAPALPAGSIFGRTVDGGVSLAIAPGADIQLLAPSTVCSEISWGGVANGAGYLMCRGLDGTSRSTLWVTGGTPETTLLLSNDVSFAYDWSAQALSRPNTVLISTGYELVLTDNTPLGTKTLVLPVRVRSAAVALSDRIVFAGGTGAPLTETMELYAMRYAQLFDTVPPVVTCPPNQAISVADGATEVVVPSGQVTATDDVATTPTLSYSYDPGTSLSFAGTTPGSGFTVRQDVVARDLVGNSARCSFEILFTRAIDAGVVQVTDAGQTPPRRDAGTGSTPSPETQGCGCGSTDGASLLFVLAAVARLRRGRRDVV